MSEQVLGTGADPDVVLGSVRLTEKDLEVPIVEMSWVFRARRALATVLALGAAAVVTTLLVVRHASGEPAFSPVAAAGPALFAVVFVGMLFWAPKRAARRVLQALAARGDSEVSYRFDAEGVTIRASGSTTTFAYRTLAKTIEGTTAFMLFVNPLVANIIPKRAFSADGLACIHAHLAAHKPPVPAGAGARKLLLMWAVLIVTFVGIWLLMNAKTG